LPTQKLSKLKQIWYRKLAQSGFKDIEPQNHHKCTLIQWHSMYFSHRYAPQEFENIQSYYLAASHFLESDRLARSPVEKEIWSMHCEGKPLRYIALKIQRRHDVIRRRERYNKDKVGAIIKNIEKDMFDELRAERNEQG